MPDVIRPAAAVSSSSGAASLPSIRIGTISGHRGAADGGNKLYSISVKSLSSKFEAMLVSRKSVASAAGPPGTSVVPGKLFDS
jgi:hypothetical protein